MGAQLKFHNVTLGYDRHPAVHHLTGEVAAGALVAVIGPNGAGKSTLFRGLAGILKPLSGSIDLGGLDIAALSAMTGVKIETLDRLISGDRYDPILIAGKSIDLEWATVRALILLRIGPNRTASPTDIEDARMNYMRLMPSTAQRVVAFWKTR